MRYEEVAQKESEVMAMPWQPHDPLVLLIRPIENLQKLVEQAGVPYSEMQLLQKYLSIMRNTRDFEHAIAMGENLTEANKTWETFKTHFHEAQLNLKNIRGLQCSKRGAIM